MTGERTLLGGAALLSGGVAGVVVRYALFPLQLPISVGVRGVLIGLLAGLVVVGLQWIVRARREGASTRPGPLALAVLGPGALVVGLGVAVAPLGATGALVSEVRHGSAAEVELEEVALPGLRISLPAWSRTHESLDPSEGRIELADPGGLDRHLKLDWKLSERPPDSFFEEVFVARGLAMQERQAIAVDGVAAQRLYFADDVAGKRVALTYWSCPADPRTFNLLSFLNLEREDLLRLHQRILDSVSCEDPPTDFAPVFPVLDEPGLERLEQATGIGYATAEGEVYFFTPGTSEVGMTQAFMADAELRRTIVRGMELQPAPDAFAGAPQKTANDRLVFSGRITDPQNKAAFTILMTAFTCDDRAFIGLVFPAEADPSEHALRRLGDARCPTP